MEEQLDLVQQVYELVVNFAVTYSFQLLGALLVVIAGYVIGGWVSRVVLRVQERRNVDITLRQFIANVARMLVIGMFLVIALSQVGISITPLIAAIGGLAVGASLAIQGPVSNYGAGLVIILTRMFKVGDTISLLGCSGQVEDISLATTILRAEDGEQIIIPNKHIIGEIHRNSQASRIVEGQVGVAYDSDPEQVIAIIERCLVGLEGVTTDARPQVGINSFGDSSIIMDYRVWVATDRYFETLHRCNLQVFNALKDNGVTIPFPQRELRMLG